MSTKKKRKINKQAPGDNTSAKKKINPSGGSVYPWVFIVIAITAICFFPMLQNGFTNWDDTYYVVQNRLIRDPDWYGIFTEPVVSNYHPLTMLSLALNYQLSALDPFSYHLVNYLFHLLNTGLVFYFIYIISGNKIYVAFFTALVFGIHPMHVESVAWIAERKDVLYTCLFLLSLIQYWKFLNSGNRTQYWFSLLLFCLSLLSKPAATVLPLILLLLDYWKGKTVSIKLLTDKIPFFIAALVIGFLTVKIQSRGAIAGFDLYPFWVRPFFGCYTLMTYFIRFFIPYPLSAFHPYPSPDNLGAAVYASPVFVLLLLFALWYYRKNKNVVFGLIFFIINLLLVLQVLSIGFTIVSERYTYVPYIGLAFMAGMWLYQRKGDAKKQLLVLSVIVSVIFGYMTFQRTGVWENGGTLWDDVIKHYPEASMPRANRAAYLAKLAIEPANAARKDSMLRVAIEDCNYAIEIAPQDPAAYEKRGLISLIINNNNYLKNDAFTLIKLQPENNMGYYLRGMYYMRINEPDKSLADLNQSLAMKPTSDVSLDARGSLLVNAYQRYSEALNDFNRGIQLNPDVGGYYMNRSICYYKLGNIEQAKADALRAIAKGAAISDLYKGLLKL